MSWRRRTAKNTVSERNIFTLNDIYEYLEYIINIPNHEKDKQIMAFKKAFVVIRLTAIHSALMPLRTNLFRIIDSIKSNDTALLHREKMTFKKQYMNLLGKRDSWNYKKTEKFLRTAENADDAEGIEEITADMRKFKAQYDRVNSMISDEQINALYEKADAYRRRESALLSWVAIRSMGGGSRRQRRHRKTKRRY